MLIACIAPSMGYAIGELGARRRHPWLLRRHRPRLADEVRRAPGRGQRILRLIQKWLTAGVMENGRWTESKVGSPQGATVSPLLANIYLRTRETRTCTAAGDCRVPDPGDGYRPDVGRNLPTPGTADTAHLLTVMDGDTQLLAGKSHLATVAELREAVEPWGSLPELLFGPVVWPPAARTPSLVANQGAPGVGSEIASM